MKNLPINCLIVSLIEPPLNIFFRLFCFAIEDLYNDGAMAVMDLYAEHFVIFVYVLMDYLVVKTLLLQLCKKIKSIVTPNPGVSR